MRPLARTRTHEDPVSHAATPDGDPEAPEAADAGDAGPGAPTAQSSGSPGGGRGLPARLAPWLLVALALAVAVVATVQWQSLRAVEDERSAVQRTASTFMLELTTWDAADGMAETRETLQEAGTERFAGEVDELFGTTEDLAALSEIGASSEGSVEQAYVQAIEGEQATVLVVVDQALTTQAGEGSQQHTRYAELSLLQRDDAWLIDDVVLLVDARDQEGGAAAPGGGGAASEGAEQAPDADAEAGEADGAGETDQGAGEAGAGQSADDPEADDAPASSHAPAGRQERS